MDTVTPVTTRGGAPHIQKTMKSASRWLIHYLLGPRLARAVRLNIVLLENLKKTQGIIGDCTWTDDNVNPREFEIRLDVSLTPYSRMLALSHELIHLKQYAKLELYDYQQNGLYPHYVRFQKKQIDSSKIAYRKYPWEVEAYSNEKPVLMAWVNATNSHHLIKQRRDR